MLFKVVCTDGKIHHFFDQDESGVDEVMTAVTNGLGFSLRDDKSFISYAPGSVARVGFVKKKADQND